MAVDIAMLIYLAKPGGKREGPFTLEQINRDLASRKYSYNDFWAWFPGMPEWAPLHALPGIFTKAGVIAPAIVVPEPQPTPAVAPAPAKPAAPPMPAAAQPPPPATPAAPKLAPVVPPKPD